MRRKLFFKDAFAALEYESDLYCLVLQWKGQGQSHNFQLALENGLEMHRLTNARFWIHNLTHMESVPEADHNWISDEWMQETLELGLEKILIVVSPAIFEEAARADLQRRQVFPQDIVAFFSDETEARHYLGTLL